MTSSPRPARRAGAAPRSIRNGGTVLLGLVAAGAAWAQAAPSAEAQTQTAMQPASAPAMQGPSPYGPPTPAELQPAPDAIRPAGVSDPLFRAAEQAVATYPAITGARSALRGAGSEVKAARWLQFPSVSVNSLALASGSRQGSDGLENTIQVDQPIWAGGRISANIRRARAGEQSARARLSETALTVSLQLTQAYFEMARLARRQEILTTSVANHRTLIDSIARRVEGGVSPNADLLLARSRTAQIEQELSVTMSQRYAAIQRFTELVGGRFDVGSVPTYMEAVHHPAPNGAIEQALTCSPRRQRLIADARVAQADYEIAKARILPQLSAQLAHSEILGTRFGLALRAQTDGGLSQFAAADAALFRKQASDQDIVTAEREIREQLVNDLIENQAVRARISSSGVARVSAGQVTESYQRQFVAGRRTWLDVMNAVREATTAELGEADAEVSAMATTARILLNTCRWQPGGLTSVAANESQVK